MLRQQLDETLLELVQVVTSPVAAKRMNHIIAQAARATIPRRT
jgi:hypothetical protein